LGAHPICLLFQCGSRLRSASTRQGNRSPEFNPSAISIARDETANPVSYKILIHVIARDRQLRKALIETGRVEDIVNRERSPLECQAADVLRRARRLPIGPDRNDLRHLALGLRWLHRHGADSLLKTCPSPGIAEQRLDDATSNRAI
jgi:hypothetical protein